MGGMIKSVDDGIGRIIAKLEKLKLKEKTIILFYSDNGGYGPATSMHPLKGYKGTYYEGRHSRALLCQLAGSGKASFQVLRANYRS